MEWKRIDLFPDYEINKSGQIRSYRRNKPRILKPGTNSKGYKQVWLWGNKGNKTFQVHRLVMEIFYGRCPKGYQVNHKNGIKTDNYIDNLEYLTPSENCKHAYKLRKRGCKR